MKTNLNSRLDKLERTAFAGALVIVWDDGQPKEEIEAEIARHRSQGADTIVVIGWRKPRGRP